MNQMNTDTSFTMSFLLNALIKIEEFSFALKTANRLHAPQAEDILISLNRLILAHQVTGNPFDTDKIQRAVNTFNRSFNKIIQDADQQLAAAASKIIKEFEVTNKFDSEEYKNMTEEERKAALLDLDITER